MKVLVIKSGKSRNEEKAIKYNVIYFSVTHLCCKTKYFPISITFIIYEIYEKEGSEIRPYFSA